MKKYLTEFVGTLFLVLIIGLTQNPLAIGFGLTILVYMGAHISGAHYNPVVSLAMFITKEIGGIDFIIIKIVKSVNKALKLLEFIFLFKISKGRTPLNSILIR